MRKLLVLVFAVALWAPPALAGEPGTYQLFQGAYPFSTLKGLLYWDKALFRINTATGEVWVARTMQLPATKTGPGKVVQGWVKFEQEFTLIPTQKDRR